LIGSAKAAKAIREGVAPIGASASPEFPLPRCESQVRPLLRIKDQQLLPGLWLKIVDHTGGRQPTARVVRDFAAGVLAGQGKHTARCRAVREQDAGQRRAELRTRLKAAIAERKSWDLVERLFGQLDRLL
jgi:hypothetical protein